MDPTSAGRVWTLDLGNTNASLASTSLRGPSSSEGLAVTTLLASGPSAPLDWLDEVLGALQDPERPFGEGRTFAAVSAVGAPALEESAAGILQRFGARTLVRPDAGLVLDIESPETCGSDRQYAMRSALEQARAAGATCALVVDAGTALTVDAGEWRASVPTFLGGAIALGPGSAALALERAGARLPRVELRVDAPALGRSTTEAIAAGVIVGFRGAVRELVRGVLAEAFSARSKPQVFLTGGARSFAAPALEGLPGGAPVLDPLLVHRGLALAALR